MYVTFSCKTSGGSGEIVDYYWEFNGKFLRHDSHEQIVSRLYFTPDWHSAEVTVTDSEGNTASDTVMVYVIGWAEWYWELIQNLFDFIFNRE